MKYIPVLCAGLLLAGAAHAQSTTAEQQPSARDRVGEILGTIFGGRFGTSNSLETQWAAGRKPLSQQRAQFDSRIEADVRSGALSQTSGSRAKADYRALVDLEARYGADGRFTTQERTELADRYGALTQALADGGYRDENSDWVALRDGRTEFDRRVDTAVRDRRISRTQGSRLKSDYAALVTIESGYLRDGSLNAAERSDLEARLDALDARVGDVGYSGSAALDPSTRLDAIARALPASGLTPTAQAQLRVEHGDLARLAAAYARVNVTADDEAYLKRRLSDLEVRARVRR